MEVDVLVNVQFPVEGPHRVGDDVVVVIFL